MSNTEIAIDKTGGATARRWAWLILMAAIMAASGAASAGARIVPRAALATHQKCETDSKQCEGPDTAQTSFAVVMLRCPLSMTTSACQQSGKLLTSQRHRKFLLTKTQATLLRKCRRVAVAFIVRKSATIEGRLTIVVSMHLHLYIRNRGKDFFFRQTY